MLTTPPLLEVDRAHKDPTQSLSLWPTMRRNVTYLRDELAQRGGVQRVVLRILKSVPIMTGFKEVSQLRPSLGLMGRVLYPWVPSKGHHVAPTLDAHYP